MPEAAPPALAATSVFRRTFDAPGPRAWLRVEQAATRATVRVNGRHVGAHLGAWTPFEFEITEFLRPDGRANELEITCEDCLRVTNGFLPAIGVRWTGAYGVSILAEPAPRRGAAAQRSSVLGTKLLVDGRPFRVRGILHWGYYPEQRHPWPSESQIRSEIVELQSFGFNLIKFCLWIPPRRYYELCEELGMFVWQEYPVWNQPLRRSPPEGDTLLAEFGEFFRNDAPYGCVILRSLTCENDHIEPELGRELVELAHREIPGCLVLDNSGWLCKEHVGDFHDEHPYVHNAHWKFYAARMRDKLHKPLLLGETMVADTLDAARASDWVHNPAGAPPLETAEARLAAQAALRRSYAAALRVRRHQVETLARELPDAGYVICGLRDLPRTPLGLYTHDGAAKYAATDWAWHATPAQPREIPDVSDATRVIGPRKGEWKHGENTWWSPIVRVLDPALPAELIEREAAFELLSGRVLTHTAGARVLVELGDIHSGELKRHPLVIEYRSNGRRGFASALRHDTPSGRMLWELLEQRRQDPTITDPPEIGPLVGTSIVLSRWEMSTDGLRWVAVVCDTPLVNRGVTMFEGRATFRTRFSYPGGASTLRLEAVGDWFEVLLNGRVLGEFGPRDGTWDGTRDIPREIPVRLAAREHEMVIHVRDWRAGGGLVGPIYLFTNPDERVF